MSMSTFQKVTLVSCVLLCIALLLPKMLLSGGRKDAAMKEGPAGQFPPVMQRKSVPMLPRGTGGNRPHNPEAIARAKGSTAAGGKSNLAGQIIPVYGFGILLYILYIIFKITSKGKTSKPHENRFPAMRSENMKRKITDFELTQLQERLKETEEVMERIVSRARAQHENTDSFSLSSGDGGVAVDQEEKLLVQLREITRVMQEGCLMDGFPSETKKQDHNYHQQFTNDDVWTPHCSLHNQNQTEVEPSCCKGNCPAEGSVCDDVRVDGDYDDMSGGGEEKISELMMKVLSSQSEDQSSGTSEIRRRRGTEAPS